MFYNVFQKRQPYNPKNLKNANRINGAYCFRIHGSVYHRIGTSLLPSVGRAPCFVQIYIYDAANELQNRHSIASHISIETLGQLQLLMHDINPYVRELKQWFNLTKRHLEVCLTLVWFSDQKIVLTLAGITLLPIIPR
jgi:hypothetical protein